MTLQTARTEAIAATKVITANFTRPSDTTAYAADDAVTDSTSAPTVITFANAARANGGSGLIVGAVLVKSTNDSTGESFDLLLADTTFAATNDNAAFAMSDAEARTLLGVVNFASATNTGANNRAYIGILPNGPIPFVCGAASTSLFGGLVARGAYAPANAERFDIRLLIQQD